MPDERPDAEWHVFGSNLFEDLVAAVWSRLRNLSEGFAESPVDDSVVRAHHVARAENLLVKPDLLPNGIHKHLAKVGAGEVFLSYSTQDEAWASEFEDDLKNEGLKTFLASRSIKAGDDWDEEIWTAIRQCNLFVALLTNSAIKSKWCLLEAGAARGLGKVVVPVLRHISKSDLPDALKQFQAREAQSREQQRQLVSELNTLLKRGKV